jgi:hypothetical protein
MTRLALLAALAASPAIAAPQEVRVGVHLRNVESVDLVNDSYHLNFVLWMKWKGELDPTKTFRFVNLLEAWALTSQPAFDEPQVLPDGWRYQRFNVEGRFFNKFQLGAYPLDWQEVVLELEDVRHPKSALEYVAEAESQVEPGLVVPGWTVEKQLQGVATAKTHNGSSAAAHEASRYRFGVQLQRPVRLMLFTMAPPVLLVLLCCFAVFFLRPQHVEARIGTVITALLTVVFLQLAFTEDLPWLGNSVLLDQLFNYSYLMMTAALVQCVVVTRWHDRAQAFEAESRATESQLIRARIRRLDRAAARVFVPLYVVGCLALVLLGKGAR